MEDIERFEALTLKEWRSWLRKNHRGKKRVLLIRHKKHTGRPTFNNMQAMREAICFGWIDTTIKRIDEDRYGQTFVRRGKKSRWSNNTLRYARELIKEKRMSRAGLAAYEAGRKKPTIDADIPKDAPIPEALKLALTKDKKAKQFFDSLAPSYRRVYIVWVLRAVREETVQRRIKTVVENCRTGKRWGE